MCRFGSVLTGEAVFLCRGNVGFWGDGVNNPLKSQTNGWLNVLLKNFGSVLCCRCFVVKNTLQKGFVTVSKTSLVKEKIVIKYPSFAWERGPV